MIEELQRDGFIKYYGYQEDVRPFIRDCHCVVLPSYHEGMANVLLEGAAMGRVLITSDIYGCKEAVVEGVNGWTCKVKDSEALYEKMRDFVYHYIMISFDKRGLFYAGKRVNATQTG